MSKILFVSLLLFSFAFLGCTQNGKPALIKDPPIQTINSIDTDNLQKIKIQKVSPQQNIQQINKILSEQSLTGTLKRIDPNAKATIDLYNLANTIFNSQPYFGDFCDRCKKLQYFAFRIGNNYLTAKPTFLKFQASSSPLNSQLFIGQQQVDGTWAFKSLTQGRYIRADNNGVTINYQNYVGAWERWYMERHGNHVHVQSAQFEHNYWVTSAGTLEQFNGGASSVIVQHWPKLQWLWNW